MACRHSSAMNGAISGDAAASNADAVAVPTPFKLLSAVIADSMLGSLRNAFLVSAITARGVFTLMRYDNCGYAFPLCKCIKLVLFIHALYCGYGNNVIVFTSMPIV